MGVENKASPKAQIAEEIKFVIEINCSHIKNAEFIHIPKIINFKINWYGEVELFKEIIDKRCLITK